MSARDEGIVRTNSFNLFKDEVPECTHSPILQGIMQQETISKYQPACWLKGFCLKSSTAAGKNHVALHQMIIKEIRDQINRQLPPAAAKEYISSGDVAIAVRTAKREPTGDSSSDGPTSSLKVYLLCSMALKPASAVFAAMNVKPLSEGVQSAYLQQSEAGLAFETSWDLVSELLQGQKHEPALIYLNVLEHKPLILGCFSVTIREIARAYDFYNQFHWFWSAIYSTVQ